VAFRCSIHLDRRYPARRRLAFHLMLSARSLIRIAGRLHRLQGIRKTYRARRTWCLNGIDSRSLNSATGNKTLVLASKVMKILRTSKTRSNSLPTGRLFTQHSAITYPSCYNSLKTLRRPSLLRPKSQQSSFYGSYLYDRIVCVLISRQTSIHILPQQWHELMLHIPTSTGLPQIGRRYFRHSQCPVKLPTCQQSRA